MYLRLTCLVLAGAVVVGCGSSAAGPAPTRTAQTAFAHPPPTVISAGHSYTATVVTSDGTFSIKLLPKVAPIAVNNFVFLARRHYYDNIPIFRIYNRFMFQTGDPTGTGTGGPGYSIKDEKVTMPYSLGTVAMANTGQPNTASAQFFVIVAPVWKFKKPSFTIFGKVVSGFNVLQKISNTPVQVNPVTQELSEPVNDVTVYRIRVRG